MIFWHEIPLLRFFLAFLAGILIACMNRDLNYVSPIVYIPPGIVFSAYLLFPKQTIRYKSRWILGLSIFTLAALMGYDVTLLRDSRSRENWIGYLQPTAYEAVYKVKLLNDPVRKGKYLKIPATLETAVLPVKGQSQIPVSGHVLVYLETPFEDSLHYGDIVLVSGKWVCPPKALNPGSFDYAEYLFFKHIHYIMYVKDRKWKRIDSGQGNPVIALAKSWQTSLVNIYKSHDMGTEEQAVGAAMILGKYENFSDDLRDSYAAAGVTHILSVSGMHVGIVFVVFQHLLFFLNRGKWARICKALLLVGITWFYALLTGLSPPVMRAAAMFTFLIAGQMNKRKSNIINTLASSALLLLIYDPYLIADIGFQLSYLAVAGIVLAGNPLYQRISPSGYIMDKIWQLVAISIGAQLFTLPIALYHFMQFPLYFIPANLVIIPLSTLVMYTGMAVLAFEPVPLISDWLSKAFSLSIQLMNYLIAWVEKLPFASLKGLYINIPEAFILSGIVVLSALMIQEKMRKPMLWLSILVFGWAALSAHRKIAGQASAELSVYATRKGNITGFREGRTIQLFYYQADTSLMTRQLQRDFLSGGVSSVVWKPLSMDSTSPNQGQIQYLQWRKQTILIISGLKKINSPEDTLEPDFLILSGLRYRTTRQLLTKIRPGRIILAQDMSRNAVNWVTSFGKANGISVHKIREYGAFKCPISPPDQ